MFRLLYKGAVEKKLEWRGVPLSESPDICDRRLARNLKALGFLRATKRENPRVSGQSAEKSPQEIK